MKSHQQNLTVPASWKVGRNREMNEMTFQSKNKKYKQVYLIDANMKHDCSSNLRFAEHGELA